MIKHKTQREQLKESEGKGFGCVILAPCDHRDENECDGPVAMYYEQGKGDQIKIIYLCEKCANEMVQHE